ncbi:MAG: MipA/OmpV family protein [Granulosicoccus sp.]
MDFADLTTLGAGNGEKRSRSAVRRSTRQRYGRLCFLLMIGFFSFHQPLAAQTQSSASNQASGAISTQSTITQKPKWEVGVGGGYFLGYDYPASNDTNQRAIALPYFIYRTPLFRFGDGGIRAVAVERPRLKLDLSIGGSLNASSQGNSARQGMPDLDFLFEIGPQLELRLFEKRLASGSRLLARFSSEIRAVFSTDFRGIESQGFIADMGVGVNVNNIADSGITLISGLYTSIADETMHDYFYQVDPEFVTETRPLYDARGGYLESTLFLGFAFQPLPQVRVFTGVIKGFYNGASNQDSPLFEVSEQTRYALGVAWTIKTSKHMVDVVDMGSSD